jgi:predicted  nucleic acid-binding Zn ribbon protein
MVMKDKTFMNKASQIISFQEKWATLDAKQMEILWKSIHWKSIEKRVNKLQSRITRAVKEGKMGLAKKLQHLLTNSFFAKLRAVRKVTVPGKSKERKGNTNMPPIEQLVNELLERSAVKVARSVLRGEWQSDLPFLPDFFNTRKKLTKKQDFHT